MTKRRRVVSDDEGDLALEVRRTDTEVDVIRQSRTRARPKKRANRTLVAAEVSDSSVEKIVAPIVSTLKFAAGRVTTSCRKRRIFGSIDQTSSRSTDGTFKGGNGDS